MRKYLQQSSVVTPLLLVLFVACATLPDKRVYDGLRSADVLVMSALIAWADYCKAAEGTPAEVTLAQHLRVKAAYEAYRSAAVRVADTFARANPATAQERLNLLAELQTSAVSFCGEIAGVQANSVAP